MRKDVDTDPQALADYIDGIWALKKTNASDPRYSRYDWYVYWHISAMMTITPPHINTDRNAAHSGPAFLPWHRLYLKRLEAEIALMLDKPDFALPYWNWVTDGALSQSQQRKAPIWADNAMGGSGFPVKTGNFAFDTTTPDDPDNWAVKIVISNNRAALTHRGLNRDLGVTLHTLPSKTSTLSTILRMHYDDANWDRTTTSVFRNELEGWKGAGMHNRVHRWVGGDMRVGHSPNDPVFFLHHCNVDRIWAFWQSRNGTGNYAPDDTATLDLNYHRLSDMLFVMTDDPAPSESIANMLADPSAQYDSFDDLQQLIDDMPTG